MNERIKQLAELSIKESGQEFWWLTNDLVIEKFAELIVRQCIFEMVHESTLQDNTKIQDFSVAVANRIEKHFGVEE